MFDAFFRHLPRRFAPVSFRDRVVVLSGGSRGLGLELARAFAEEGARLALLARDPVTLERAVNGLAVHDAIGIECDVTDPADVQAAVASIVRRFGRIDVLVNNAGAIEVGPFEHMAPEDWEHAMALHVRAPLLLTQACLPHMEAGARIANVSSIGGLVAVPHMGPYCASKHALVGLSDTLRAELAPRGIAVTTVCPGLMRTGSPPHVLVKGRHEAEYRWFATFDSLPFLSQPSERAARSIVRAIRWARPRVITTVPAKVLAVADAVTPGFVAWAMRVFESFLPPPEPVGGDVGLRGAVLRAPGWAEQSIADAGRRNNERQ